MVQKWKEKGGCNRFRFRKIVYSRRNRFQTLIFTKNAPSALVLRPFWEISQPWPKKCSKRAPQGLLESFRSPGPKSAPNELLRASWKKCSKRAPEGLLEQFRSADRKSAPNELLRAFLEPFEFAALAQQVLQTSS